ncbi:hypothetical protein LINPERHAP2_LOCUS42886, partial [Linum perenne]
FSDKKINLCHLLLHTDAPNQFSSAPNQFSSAPNPISRLVAAIVSDYPHLRVLLSSPSSPIILTVESYLSSPLFELRNPICSSIQSICRCEDRFKLEQALTTIPDVGYTRWVYHSEQFNADEDDLNMLDNDLLQVDEDDEEDKDEDENEGDEDNLFDLLDEHEEFIQNDNNLEGDANDLGERRKSQNSGVMVQGNHIQDIIDFYGVLDDIIRLDYVRDKVVFLFKCDWYDVDKRQSRILQDGALTSIRVDRLWYINDPFVLATQVNQVFYINDPKLGVNWRVVHQFNHRHIFVGEFETEIDVYEVEGNDDAYQDEELSNETVPVVELDIAAEQSLRRDDAEPEVISTVIRSHDVGGEHEQVSHHESDKEDDLDSIFDTTEEESDSLHSNSENYPN